MMHESKITPATSPLFCNPIPSKTHTLLLISMSYFRMCNILKFTQNSLVVLIPYLLIYSEQCFFIIIIIFFNELLTKRSSEHIKYKYKIE